LFRVLVAHAGRPTSWPRRAVVTAGLAAGLGIALAAAADFTAKKLRPLEEQWLAHVDSNDPTTFRVVTALLLGGFLWLAHRVTGGALDKTMLMSSRVRAVAASAMLVAEHAIP
jgi:hypothetical protein